MPRLHTRSLALDRSLAVQNAIGLPGLALRVALLRTQRETLGGAAWAALQRRPETERRDEGGADRDELWHVARPKQPVGAPVRHVRPARLYGLAAGA